MSNCSIHWSTACLGLGRLLSGKSVVYLFEAVSRAPGSDARIVSPFIFKSNRSRPCGDPNGEDGIFVSGSVLSREGVVHAK